MNPVSAIFEKNNKNISLLLSLNTKDRLLIDSKGGLALAKGKKEFYIQKIKWLLRGQNMDNRVQKQILFSYSLFMNVAKHPIDQNSLAIIYEKTVKAAERIACNIENHRMLYHLSALMQKKLQLYKKNSYIQLRLIKDIQIKCGHNLKKPHPLLQDALLAIDKVKPEPPKRGASGSYLMKGLNRYIAGVFKPFDEEIKGPNNPLQHSYRGHIGKLVYGSNLTVGRGVFREVAAYEVSRYLNLFIVPFTCFASFSHEVFFDVYEGQFMKEYKTKMGSFQEYYAGYVHISDLSTQEKEALPAEQLHKVLLLDIIIGNLDRNHSNLLTNGKVVIAIDHALSFPKAKFIIMQETLKDLPQFALPFFGQLKETILSLDGYKLKKKLKLKCAIETEALLEMEKRIYFLKECVAKNIPPNKIIKLLY